IITGSTQDGRWRLWDRATGLLERAVLAHRGGVSGCAFSPDGLSILTYSRADGRICLWSAATGGITRTLAWSWGESARIVAAAFEPDSDRVLAITEDRLFGIWSSSSGRMTMEQHIRVFGPEGGRVVDLVPVGSSQGLIYVFEVASDSVSEWKLGEDNEYGSLAPGLVWTEYGSAVAVAEDRIVVRNGEAVSILTRNGEKVARLDIPGAHLGQLLARPPRPHRARTPAPARRDFLVASLPALVLSPPRGEELDYTTGSTFDEAHGVLWDGATH